MFSDKEGEDRRSKGIFFYCDEKCSPTHNCPKMKLFSMEIHMIEERVNISQDSCEEVWITLDLD